MTADRESNLGNIRKDGNSKNDVDLFVPKGQPNLGNTCFFNSVVQCLMNTEAVTMYINGLKHSESIVNPSEYISKVGEVSVRVPAVNIPLPNDFPMPLVKAFCNFISDYRSGKTPNPRNLFESISRKAPRFRGWQQQDSHELLRYLLDGLRQEEIGRFSRAFKNFNDIEADDGLDKDQILLCKAYLDRAARPLLDAVFGGMLVQSINCSECGHLSITFEPFLDLSLPLSRPSDAIYENGHDFSNSKDNKPSKHQKKKEKSKRKNSRKKQKGKTNVRGRYDSLAEDNLDTGSCDVDDENTNGECVEETEEVNSIPDEKITTTAEKQTEETPQANGVSHAVSDHAEVFMKIVDDHTITALSVSSSLHSFTNPEMLGGSNAYECENCCKRNKNSKDTENKSTSTKRTVEAIKRYLIIKPPLVLTIHLKRFEQVQGRGTRTSTKKFRGHVRFDLNLDLAPYCSRNVKRILPGQRNIWYSLYGLVCHYGDLSSGHYIAYVKARPNMEVRIRELFERSFSGELEEVTTALGEKCKGLSLRDEKVGESADEIFSDLAANSKWYYVSDSSVSLTSERRVLEAEAFILFYERIS